MFSEEEAHGGPGRDSSTRGAALIVVGYHIFHHAGQLSSYTNQGGASHYGRCAINSHNEILTYEDEEIINKDNYY